MKKTGILLSLIFFFASGCGRFVSATEAVDAIQKAAANNHRLENAKFETLLSMESAHNQEENFYQKTDGAFIKTDEEKYDWHYVTYFPGKYTLISSELVERSGQQFHKVIIDPLERAEWRTLAEPLRTFDGIAVILNEPELLEGDIENVIVEKEETGTHYRLRMKDDYLERQKSELIADAESAIAFLKNTEAQETIIESHESRLDEIKNTYYNDMTVTYTVNEQNFLTCIQHVTDITMPDGLTFTFENTHSLLDYNLEDASALVPTLEK